MECIWQCTTAYTGWRIERSVQLGNTATAAIMFSSQKLVYKSPLYFEFTKLAYLSSQKLVYKSPLYFEFTKLAYLSSQKLVYVQIHSSLSAQTLAQTCCIKRFFCLLGVGIHQFIHFWVHKEVCCILRFVQLWVYKSMLRHSCIWWEVYSALGWISDLM